MSQLLDLIKRHEGFRTQPYWDKTGQEMWEAIREEEGDVTDLLKIQWGHLTIGYGFNLEAPRSSEFWEYVLRWDLDQAIKEAARYEWFDNIGPYSAEYLNDLPYSERFELIGPRQAVIVSMIYQLGPTGFAGFKRMQDWLIAGGRFDKVADEMLDSKWAREDSPARAKELAKMMRTGEW